MCRDVLVNRMSLVCVKNVCNVLPKFAHLSKLFGMRFKKGITADSVWDMPILWPPNASCELDFKMIRKVRYVTNHVTFTCKSTLDCVMSRFMLHSWLFSVSIKCRVCFLFIPRFPKPFLLSKERVNIFLYCFREKKDLVWAARLNVTWDSRYKARVKRRAMSELRS